MKRLLAGWILCLALPASAGAAPIVYTANLTGPNEFPANGSPATGAATITYDTGTLEVDVTFSGLVGGPAAASHIHCCVSPSAATPTAVVAVLFPGFPNATSGTYHQTFDLTQSSTWNAAFVTANGGSTAGAEAALAAGLASGFAYVNVHDAQFPGGEIRGFLVPEPATAGLVAAGITTIALARRRARAEGGRR